MKINIYILVLLLVGGTTLTAQESSLPDKKVPKTWEIGLGPSIFQFNRTSFSNFSTIKGEGSTFSLHLNQLTWGSNLYAAKELNKHFYWDIQGSVGFTDKALQNHNKNKWFFMFGSGIQWRLGEYFDSKYVDPYLRVGVNYMFKDFNVLYKGTEGLTGEQMDWIMKNVNNKDGADKNHLIPIAAGAGINLWLNDRLGIGFQTDYLAMPYKNVANSLQGSARIMWRIGGKSKKTVEYVQVPVEVDRIVEKVVYVDKITEVSTNTLSDLFGNIYFEFASEKAKPESEVALDRIASFLVMEKNVSKRFLITGFADAIGTQEFNLTLSKKRAAYIMVSLLKRGVPEAMLKSRGVGKKISHAKADASDSVREGDRKITIELINNMDYWNYITE